jgi:predicted NBD/HSP70 family sugar kinase
MIVAGLDIGGTKTLAVIVGEHGDVLATTRLATQSGDPSIVVEHAVATLDALAEAAGIEVGHLAAVGVGLPGIVDTLRGEVRHAVNLGIDGLPAPLGRAVHDATGIPTIVVNDVDAAAVGAAALLGGSQPDLAYLSIGTGVAAGLVLDGRLRRGSSGAAGEIGHIVIDPTGPPCPCGQRGCLEALVSGPAIARRWPAPVGQPVATHLVSAAVAGDETATSVLAEVGGHLASAVQLLGLAFDPRRIVLGGGVVEAGEPLADAVRTALAARARTVPLLGELDLAERIVVLPSDAAPGATGAAMLARSGLDATAAAP